MANTDSIDWGLIKDLTLYDKETMGKSDFIEDALYYFDNEKSMFLTPILTFLPDDGDEYVRLKIEINKKNDRFSNSFSWSYPTGYPTASYDSEKEHLDTALIEKEFFVDMLEWTIKEEDYIYNHPLFQSILTDSFLMITNKMLREKRQLYLYKGHNYVFGKKDGIIKNKQGIPIGAFGGLSIVNGEYIYIINQQDDILLDKEGCFEYKDPEKSLTIRIPVEKTNAMLIKKESTFVQDPGCFANIKDIFINVSTKSRFYNTDENYDCLINKKVKALKSKTEHRMHNLNRNLLDQNNSFQIGLEEKAFSRYKLIRKEV